MGLLNRIARSNCHSKRTIVALRLINNHLKQEVSKRLIYLDTDFLIPIPEVEQEKLLTEIFSNYPEDPDIRNWRY